MLLITLTETDIFDTTKYLSCSILYKNIWLHDNKGMHLSNFAFSHLGHELCALGTWYNNSNEKKFDNIILNWKRRVLLCWATRVIERQSFHISMRRRRNILYEINSYSMSFRLWKSVFWDCKKFFILAYNILFTVILEENLISYFDFYIMVITISQHNFLLL